MERRIWNSDWKLYKIKMNIMIPSGSFVSYPHTSPPLLTFQSFPPCRILSLFLHCRHRCLGVSERSLIQLELWLSPIGNNVSTVFKNPLWLNFEPLIYNEINLGLCWLLWKYNFAKYKSIHSPMRKKMINIKDKHVILNSSRTF